MTMKHPLWTLCYICIIPFFHTANAQDTVSKHAIGLRLSDASGFWAEASYQHKVTEATRIEANLGVRGRSNFNAVKLSGFYQWFFAIDNALYWYTGPGLGLGLVDYNDNVAGRDESETFGFVSGTIGMEYHFDFPLMVSIDFRPEIFFDSFNNDDLNFNIGVSARYTFQ